MAQTRPRRRRKRKPADPLDLNPAARWRFGIGQKPADEKREIRKAQEDGLGDVYLTLARRVERARVSEMRQSSKCPPPGDTPGRRATIPR